MSLWGLIRAFDSRVEVITEEHVCADVAVGTQTPPPHLSGCHNSKLVADISQPPAMNNTTGAERTVHAAETSHAPPVESDAGQLP